MSASMSVCVFVCAPCKANPSTHAFCLISKTPAMAFFYKTKLIKDQVERKLCLHSGVNIRFSLSHPPISLWLPLSLKHEHRHTWKRFMSVFPPPFHYNSINVLQAEKRPKGHIRGCVPKIKAVIDWVKCYNIIKGKVVTEKRQNNKKKDR